MSPVVMVKTGQVFISHTSDMARYPDGRSFVQAVLDGVGRAGLATVDMRYFAARDGQPAGYCRQRVRECEIYLAVVGFRYGSLVPGENVSYTELEFAEASLTGRPRLVFLLDDRGDLPAGLADADRRAVDGFRQRLRAAGLIVATFTTADRLELEVFHALREWAGGAGRVVPRQLPAAVAHFAGRRTELRTLTSLIRRPTDPGGTVVVATIGGTAGVGKTALAVFWAHQVADRFPDGQLYVNLRGFDPGGTVMQPGEAVRRFLDALGVAPQRIPVDVDARAALYRSEVAGRRMLIVLDNARDTAHVRPLLPGAAGCLVLVTSRDRLSGLVAAEGAYPLALDLLTLDEARDLLTRRIGARARAQPDAVDEIIGWCVRLPLALAIVAAHAATTPNLALAGLAGQLRDTHQRLEALSTGDAATDVRTVFSWSYHTLTAPAARLFRLLGLHPGPDITAPATASLTGTTRAAVRPLLAELTRASLLIEHTPGRYTCHDLLRAYATGLTDDDRDRRAATGRVLDHYLHTAHTAAVLLDPGRDPLRLAPPRSGVSPERLTDHGQALGWFTAEHRVLLAAVEHAAATGFGAHTWQLAWALWDFLDRRGHWHDQVAAGLAAVAAARRLADPTAQAHAHRHLTHAYIRLGRFDDADTHLRHALDLATRCGDQTTQADTHRSLAYLWELRGDRAQALDHAQQALRLFQAAGHQAGQAHARNAVGWYHAQLGDHEQALAHCQQALALHQHLGDRYGQAATWDSLGYAHHHLGQHTQATTCYQHALTLHRDAGDRYEEAATLNRLGDTHHAAGDPPAARDAWRQALAILDDLNHRDARQVRGKLAGLAVPVG